MEAIQLFRVPEKIKTVNLPEIVQLNQKDQLHGFYSIEEQDYHSSPGLSQSILKAYGKSPAHARMMMNKTAKTTEAMLLGRACHAAVFESERYNRDFVIAPQVDRRTKEGKAKFQCLLDSNQGKTILSEEDGETITGIIHSFRAHSFYDYIKQGCGYPELSYYWKAQGFLCKARFDWITSINPNREEGRIIFDLKTTEYGVTPQEVKRTILSMGYDIQAAWYQTAIPDARFIFIFAEKKPPYAIGLYELSDGMKERANEKIDYYLNIHSRCVAEQNWPPFQENEVITLDGV